MAHTVMEIQILLDYDIFGEDNGAGADKVYGRHGGMELPAQVAAGTRRHRHANVAGLRTVKPPMRVIIRGNRSKTHRSG